MNTWTACHCFIVKEFQGDSGGPLVQVDVGGRKIQVGIVSYGFMCPDPATPRVGAYTNVKMYLDWIYSKTKI